jgi:hypothetical protein
MSNTSKVIVTMVFAVLMMIAGASAQTSTLNGTVGDVDATPDPVGNVTVNVTVNETENGNVTVPGNETASDDSGDDNTLVVVVGMGVMVCVAIVILKWALPRKSKKSDTPKKVRTAKTPVVGPDAVETDKKLLADPKDETK